MGFRAALNFRKFKVALNSMYRRLKVNSQQINYDHRGWEREEFFSEFSMESNFCINLFHSRIYIHNSRYPAFTLVVTFAVFHCIKLSLLLNFKLVLEIEPASKSICSKEITTFCNPGYCGSITRRAESQLRATINVITN